ncbi:MAG: hypothetical protein WC054_02435 [Candidatus Nanopelagicales bacterium]
MDLTGLGIGFDPFEIADAFGGEGRSSDTPTIRMGLCVSVEAGETCTVTLAGTSAELAGIRYMGAPPMPGKPVRVLRQGKLLFVLGGLSGLFPAPAAIRERTTNQSCAPGVTNLSFPTSIHDPWAMFTASDTITLPCDGVWHALASAQCAANASGYRELTVMVNGAGPAANWSVRQQNLSATAVLMQAARTFTGVKGAAVTVAFGQTAGGSLNVNPATFSLHWVGGLA